MILLHGWPDDVRTFERMVPAVQGAGFQTVVPWLRGFGPTSFLSSETMRSGEMVAMAQDTLDLANALKLNTFAVVGHTIGARVLPMYWPRFIPSEQHGSAPCLSDGNPASFQHRL